MYGLRRFIFGSPLRRLLAAIAANALFYGGAHAIHAYIDEVCSSPGLSFALFVLWMGLAAVAGLVTILALGRRLISADFFDTFLEDEMAAVDALIEGRGPTVDELEEASLHHVTRGGDAAVRFGIWFLVFAAFNLLLSNSMAGGFMQRYSHPGVAVVHMRSPDARLRRQGLSMLVSKIDFDVTPAVEKVVLYALDDVDEGVAARAAYAAGRLDMGAVADKLAEMVVARPALSFVGMISLGQVAGERARAASLRVVNAPEARAEPLAMAYMLGLLRAPAVERLRQIHRDAKDTETRVAAIWALGELRDARLLEVLAEALQDPELSVRCVAAVGLEKLAEYEASPPLRAAFERVKDPIEMCPEINVPVQEDGAKLTVMPNRNYQLVLVRALASTDDPVLLRWYVSHQEGVESRTHDLMRKAWEALQEKNKAGLLNGLKHRARIQQMQRTVEGADAGR